MGPAGKDLRYGAGKIQVFDALLKLLHNVQVSDNRPSIGDTLKVNISGIPGEDYWIVSSSSPGSYDVPGVGTLDLDPPIRILFQGVIPPEGQVTEFVAIPDRPSLIGRTTYTQGIMDDRAGSTGQFLISLVESVTFRP